MDSKVMLEMINNMLGKMNSKEMESVLKNAKGVLSPQDYEKLETIVKQQEKM